MKEIIANLGVFDVAFWIIAIAVSYYLAFVAEIHNYFSKPKRKGEAKIEGPTMPKSDSLKLEKFFGSILYNSKSNVAEKLALDLHNDSNTRNIPLQTNPLESFNFDAFGHFKNDYPVVIIVDGRCHELERFIGSCQKDDSKVRAYTRTFLSNISFAVYAVDFDESKALNDELTRIGAKTMYSQKATDNFLTWKEHLFANLSSKKYK